MTRRMPCAAMAVAAAPVLLTAPDARVEQPSSGERNSQVQRQELLLAQREAQLHAAATMASRALEEHQAASRAAEHAMRRAEAETQRLVAARRATARARDRLSQYIGSMCRTGMGNRHLALHSGLMDAQPPQRLFSSLRTARRQPSTKRTRSWLGRGCWSSTGALSCFARRRRPQLPSRRSSAAPCFSTATHRGMQDNSMMFGWFHPARAQQGDSRPEAWHWEFSG